MLKLLCTSRCAARRVDGGHFRKGLIMGKKKKESKPAEDKHDKFVRVVTPRVKKALKAIGLIGMQSGAGYSYTEQDVAYIIGALRGACDAVEKRYMSSGKQDVDFSLD